jgi:hypothetical protein
MSQNIVVAVKAVDAVENAIEMKAPLPLVSLFNFSRAMSCRISLREGLR